VEINFTSQVEKEDGLLLRYASRRQKMEIFLYYTEYWVFKNQSDFSFLLFLNFLINKLNYLPWQMPWLKFNQLYS
jgi:hypothetical protein